MEQDWDFYFCRVDDKPSSIFLDLALRSTAPRENLAELVWLRLYMRTPREDGLSHKDEMQALCEVEDSLTDCLDRGASEVLYAGRATSDGCRDFYFYAADRTIESAFAQAMREHPSYSYEIGGRGDPDWQVYYRFLYPNPREHQLIQNARVVRQLEEHGDQLETPRDVQHWIYFADDASRKLFIQRLDRTGFVLEDEHDEGPEECRFVATIGKRHAVDVDSINDEVLRVFDLAVDCGGQYDGWETPVVGDSDDQTAQPTQGEFNQ